MNNSNIRQIDEISAPSWGWRSSLGFGVVGVSAAAAKNEAPAPRRQVAACRRAGGQLSRY